MNPQFIKAEELGIRLEIVDGLAIWESHPVWKHQKAVDRIRSSLHPTPKHPTPCPCIHAADVYIQFNQGSLKRPDIAIFCQEPDEEDEAITLIPEAVIEVISKGYEAKDLELGPRFYLSQGVKDVVVFDPYSLAVLHIRSDSTKRHLSPVKLQLECGCSCIV
ncbi:MAG: Uma2 family endonuclease [Deinococcales bacterium]